MHVKGAISYQKKAFSGGMGPYRLRMLLIYVQRGAFDVRRAPLLAVGAPSALKTTIMSGKSTSSCQKGAFTGGRGAIYS